MSLASWIRTPLKPLPFLGIGTGLMALKIGLDYLIAQIFQRPYSVLFYVSPMDAPLFKPGEHPTYWIAMWALALPFITIGVILTVRRLRDAGLPPALVALFFVPFANLLFFLAAGVVPSKPPKEQADGTYRDAAKPPPKDKSFLTATLMSAAAGAVIALGAGAIGIGLMKEYGAALFLGGPAISGFVASLLFCRLHEPKLVGVITATFLALLVSFGVMVAFALEGIVCLVMVAPLAGVTALIGALVGFAVASGTGIAQRPKPAPMAAFVPLFLVAELVNPIPHDAPAPVESRVIIDAPPAVVWPHVIAFPRLDPPTELVFRAGVAAPLGAVIEGRGVGAIRRCQFTTGEFVEPIEVWNEPRELTFGVLAQPDPMHELTPWPGPRPPHLDGYMQVSRGQFLLRPLPGNRTLLIGRTYYRVRMAPAIYWRAWADEIIGSVHARVLAQVKRRAEAAARRVASR